jgi:predicted nuclease of predicted toxin-antitoxin system
MADLTGNIGNRELELLIHANFVAVTRAFSSARFVELSRDVLTVHE